MNPKKTLLIDCDGVLYPANRITMSDFLHAMKETYRLDLQIDGETQSRVSAETIAQNRLGMFNYIKGLCEAKDYDFNEFCTRMFERVDYSKIFPDENLLRQLMTASRQDNVVILTNNHHMHLNRILQRRFGKTITDFEAAGIRCVDITMTAKNGVFQPKQSPQALLNLAKEIGATPEDCILLDDTSANIEMARRAGMQGILIGEQRTLQSYLDEHYSAQISGERSLKGREHG